MVRPIFSNKQCRFCGIPNPKELQQHQLHPQKYTIDGVIIERVTGSYFFTNDEIQLKRIRRDLYKNITENLSHLKIGNNQEVWFQKNGATAYNDRTTMDFLGDISSE